MLVITDIFHGGDLFFAERLKQEGEHVLLDTQRYWMSHLLPALTEYFGLEDVSIHYDEHIPLSPIWFSVKEQNIAVFSPYWRTFEEAGVPGEAELYEERNQLLQLIEFKEGELEKWATIEENPTLLGEDDNWMFAKAAFNPKKYKQMAKTSAIQVQQEIQSLQHQVGSIDLKIEIANANYLETSYYLDRIKARIERWGDFSFFAPEKEGE